MFIEPGNITTNYASSEPGNYLKYEPPTRLTRLDRLLPFVKLIINTMFERIVVIGSATVLAALVLFLTLLSEPSAPKSAKRPINDPLNVDLIPEFDPNRTSSKIDPRGRAKKYRISSVNSRGQLVELYGDTVTPLPDGVTRVTAPGARVHLAPSRALGIRAEQGTILAPDNQVRSGDFVGDVVLTLFDAMNRRVDMSPSSPDAKLHVYLHDAQFDMELGHIESDNDVHMIGPRVDFRGVGLDMTYNEKRRRIDRLEITRGRSLRFTPQPEGVAGSDDEDTEAPSLAATTDPGTNAVEENEAPSSGSDPLEEQTDDTTTAVDTAIDTNRPIQYYRARFEDHVRIQGQHATIETDRLDVVFSFDAGTDQDKNARNA